MYFPMKFNERWEVPFLKCELNDHNKWSTNDFLGDFETDICSIFDESGKWVVKKDFPLTNL